MSGNEDKKHYDAAIDVRLGLSFIDGVKTIDAGTGRKRKRFSYLPPLPATLTVDLGNFGVIIEGRPFYDHEGLEEVYLPGELVMLSERDSKQLELLQLKAVPVDGTISLRKPLLGLSLDSHDHSLIAINFIIRLVNPKRLMNQIDDAKDKDANKLLVEKME